jgi:hypothetical protein
MESEIQTATGLLPDTAGVSALARDLDENDNLELSEMIHATLAPIAVIYNASQFRFNSAKANRA